MISPQFSLLAGHCVFLAVLAWRLLTGAAADRGGWRATLTALVFHKSMLRGKS
jgi:branched-chain amino acid transport system permease protein